MSWHFYLEFAAMIQTAQKVLLWFHPSTLFSKSPLADGQQCSFWREVAFSCSPAVCTIVFQCSPDGELININICRCDRSLDMLRSSPGFLWDLVHYYISGSWKDLSVESSEFVLYPLEEKEILKNLLCLSGGKTRCEDWTLIDPCSAHSTPHFNDSKHETLI